MKIIAYSFILTLSGFGVYLCSKGDDPDWPFAVTFMVTCIYAVVQMYDEHRRIHKLEQDNKRLNSLVKNLQLALRRKK